MTPTQEVALKRAVAFLNAAGLKYAIALDDGGILGALKVEPEKTGVRRPKVNDFKPTMYREITEKMAPGDSHKWTFESTEMAEAFRKVLTSRAGLLWDGRDNYITTVTNCEVELLRVN